MFIFYSLALLLLLLVVRGVVVGGGVVHLNASLFIEFQSRETRADSL